MKYLFPFFFFLTLAISVNAQIAPPQAFNYSGVARNVSNNPIANQTIGIQLSILKGSAVTGTVVYKENHFTNTDALGLFNLAVGTGAVQSGTFSTIDWSNDTYYLRVGLDATGGTNFVTMGSTQLLSVPYALYAKSAGNTASTTDHDTSSTNELQVLSARKDTIFLTNGGFVKVPASSYDHDTSASNELQTVSIRNDTIFLTNGGFAKLPTTTGSGTKPTVTTSSATLITSTTASLQGNVTNDGGEIILTRGLCLSTTPNPTITNLLMTTSGYLGTYNFNANNLTAGTLYYLRAFATNANGTSYGNQVSFNTLNTCFQQEDKLFGYYGADINYLSGGGIDSISIDNNDSVDISNTIFSDCILNTLNDRFSHASYTNISLPSGGTSFTTPNQTVSNIYLNRSNNESYIQNPTVNITCQNITATQCSIVINIVSGTFKTTNPEYVSRGYNNKNCAGAKFSGIYTK
ncbi:MAG TPA: hypothetical protein PLX60_10650 [Chitinophagales bacterium]|jgi:hypothetical protein|nr:hypothetical protein [Chitinophagales bacterium]